MTRRAGEFDQHTISSSLDDVATMLGDFGIEKFSRNLETGQRVLFGGAHKPAVPSDIRRYNSNKSSSST